MRKIQIKIAGKWKYLLKHDETRIMPKVTIKKKDAFNAPALPFFQNKFPEYEFRIN